MCQWRQGAGCRRETESNPFYKTDVLSSKTSSCKELATVNLINGEETRERFFVTYRKQAVDCGGAVGDVGTSYSKQADFCLRGLVPRARRSRPALLTTSLERSAKEEERRRV